MIEGKTPERFVAVTSGVGDAKMDRLDHIIEQNDEIVQLLKEISHAMRQEKTKEA